MGWMVEGCLRPKAMNHLSPCPQGPRGIQPKRLPLDSRPFLSFFTASWTDERRKVTERGSEGSRSRQQATASQPPKPSIILFKALARPFRERGVSTSLARGRDSFTCIPASTTKSSGLNAPTTAVQPFLGFVESGFPFTHNGGAAPTRRAATGHNALFAQQIHFEVDLFARPIVGMCTRYHKGPISQ